MPPSPIALTEPTSLAPNIVLKGASRQWDGVFALRDVDLEIAAGARVALIGPSGSGKSTLLKLLAGALATSAGEVFVAGVSLKGMSYRQLQQHRARCGIVPQGGVLVPQLSVHHNVLTGLLPHWPWYRTAAAAFFPFSFERERTAALLAQLHLPNVERKLGAHLSGGEQQRVTIARALIASPQLILADEPTAALDPANAKRVIELVVNREQPATVLVSTHWVSLLRGYVDQLIGLRDGRVVLNKTIDTVDEDDLEALYRGSDERR